MSASNQYKQLVYYFFSCSRRDTEKNCTAETHLLAKDGYGWISGVQYQPVFVHKGVSFYTLEKLVSMGVKNLLKSALEESFLFFTIRFMVWAEHNLVSITGTLNGTWFFSPCSIAAQNEELEGVVFKCFYKETGKAWYFLEISSGVFALDIKIWYN